MDQVIDFFAKLFDSSDWPPRWHCGRWTEFHGWLYIISDLLIWSAYFTIPIVIIKYISKKHEIRFVRLYFLFAAFILACGATHFLDAIAFWIPVYRLNALFRLVTGVISWVTVFQLIKLLPVVTSLRSQKDLEIEIEQRKKAHAQLEFLSYQINQANDSIYTVDVDIKIKNWNMGAEKLYGFTKEEMMGKEPNAILKTVMAPEEMGAIIKEVAEKNYWSSELKRTTKAGAAIWVRSSLSTVRDDQGTITGYVAVSFDITGQKKLREEVSHLASMVEQSTESIISIGLDQCIMSWNNGAEKLHGYTKEEAIGKTGAALGLINLTPNEIDEVFRQVVEKGLWKTEMDFFRKDGSAFFGAVTANLIKNEQGEITSTVFIVKDISIRKKLEEQLKEFEHFFNNSNDLSCIANQEGYFEILNPSFKNVLGYSENELSENPFLDFVHPDDIPATLHQYEKLKSGALVIHFFNRYRKKDGSYLWFDWNATPNPATGKLYCIARDITDRKKAEDALSKLNEQLEQRVKERTSEIEKNEKRFRALIENNYDIISLLDESFKIIYRSPSAFRITGWSEEEMKNVDGAKNVHPDDIAYARNIIREVMANPNKPIKTLCRNQHKNGKYLWMEGLVINLLNDEQVKAIVFNFRDVTERIETAEKLAASEMHFRSLIENSAEGIALTDEFSNIIYRSPASQKITGVMPSKNTISNTHPEDLETIKNKFSEALKKPDVPIAFQGRFLHALGHYFWMEGTLTNLLHVKEVNAIVANYRDITQRKKLEDLLHKANVLARIGGWEIDLVKETVYWSDITREIHETEYNYVPELATGIIFYKEGKGRDLITQKVKEAIEFGKTWDVELQIVTAKNNERWIRTIGETEFLNGKCVRVYGSFQDIDDRKKAEENIKKLNAELEERVIRRTEQLKKSNEELEAFSYSVSHDLRAPLRAIIGFTTILEEDYSAKLDGEAKRITSIIKSNTSKMGHLIDDLLLFSRMGRQDIIKTNIDCDSLVKEIIKSQDNNITSNIKWIVHPLPYIKADLNTMRQVWVNLISNAIKYSGKAALPQIEIGSFFKEGQTAFFIKDNGVGFDEKYTHKLFKVFQRLHNTSEFEGTGVGLAIVQKVIAKHGGKVWAEALPDSGAIFYFSLSDDE